jgi:hypothetical protein
MIKKVICPQCKQENLPTRSTCIKCGTTLSGVPLKNNLKGEVSVNKDNLGFIPYIFGGLSFIPLCGVPFGVISIIWGLISKKRGSKILVIIGGLGIAVTIILYGSLYYFGFIQRGGVYDSLRENLAETQLNNLVPIIEFYKLQYGEYPLTLSDLANAQPEGQPIFIWDPTIMTGNIESRQFYYELTNNSSNYYLLGVGADNTPYTSDDMLPINDTKNTGLLINPNSKPTP